MKLWYFENNNGNFGDALNPWFWSKVTDGLLDNNSDSLLLGIGTIINNKLPTNKAISVFGSGAGYGPLPKGVDSWKIYCVRGPITAHQLGLRDDLGVTDPAALCSRLYRPALGKNRLGVSFIPHYMTAELGDWPTVCAEAGVHYISPTAPPLEVIDQIRHSDLILTEAMHGAILADSYRIPWRPVTMEHALNPKWKDWMLSLGIKESEPLVLRQVWRGDCHLGFKDILKNRIKIAAFSLKLDSINWTPPIPLRSFRRHYKIQVAILRQAAQSSDYQLSSSETLSNKLDRLEELLEKLVENLKRDREINSTN